MDILREYVSLAESQWQQGIADASGHRWLKRSENTGKWSPRVRYFACGEYGGGKTKRPHYHIVLFNVPDSYYENDPIHYKVVSSKFEEIWKNGHVDIMPVTRGTAHYITTYHLFPVVESWKDTDAREQPFAVMSRKPGIGLNYIDEQITNYFISNKNSYATLKNGIKQPLGRYYKEKIKENIPDEFIVREMFRKSVKFIREKEQEEWRRAVEIHEGDIEEAERDLWEQSRELYYNRKKQVINRLKSHGKL